MAQCEYVGPSGRRCPEAACDGSALCFWHDRNIPKSGPDIKPQLEQKARNRESMEGYELASADLQDAYLMHS